MHRRGRVVFVRLRRAADDLEELAEVTRFLDSSRRICQKPLLLLSLPAVSLAPPKDDLRRQIIYNIRQRFDTRSIEQAFLVVPTGNLFKRAIVRSLFAGIRLTQGLINRVFMYETIEEAVRVLCQRHGESSSELLAAAQELVAEDDAAAGPQA